MVWYALSLLALGFMNAADVQGQVFVVDDDGPAHFSSIRDGIQGAGEGDILLVKQGNYPETEYPYMTIDGKSLTIQAEKGHTVTIGRGCTIRNLTAAQSVRLRGLSLKGVVVHSNQGMVWIEDCTIEAQGSTPPAPYETPGINVSNSSSVALIRTSATGAHHTEWSCTDHDQAGNGLMVGDSLVHAFGCTFQGGTGSSDGLEFPGGICRPSAGGHGIELSDPASFVFLSKCVTRGGVGSCTVEDGPIVIRRAGGYGLLSEGTAVVFDSSVQGGPSVPHPWGICTSIATPDHSGPVTFHRGRALRFDCSSPVREGEPITFSFDGPPHVAVWLASGSKATSLFALSPFGTALVGQPQQVDFAGITGADGRLEFSIPMPTFLIPGYEGRAAFAQAFYLDPHPAGPLGGTGKIRHVPLRFVRGEGSMLVGLDETF